ncbi:5200_t:CDS:2, partial [Funneliformis mosseae]
RTDAASVIKDNILYVLGGFNKKAMPEILSLDFTTSMTTDSPPWKRLKVSPLAFASSEVVLGGPNNNFLFVVGGGLIDPVSEVKIVNEQTLLEYDILNNEWRRISMLNAPNLNRRVHFSLISDNNGKAYLHGGYSGTFLGDTYLFDTFSFIWTLLPAPQIPILADDFSSVLLNDGRLVIIGGYGPPENNVLVHRPISQIEIFNTIDNSWSRQIVPQPKGMTDHRRYHTSTLLPNGDVVIVGGLEVTPNVVILETTKISFQWRIPVISGLEAPMLSEHCAELVENRYIFIIFGKKTDVQLSNKLYIFDTDNYSWITNFSPNTLPQSSSPSSPSSTTSSQSTTTHVSSITIVLSIVISVLIIILLGTFVFFYKKLKNRSGNVTTRAENTISIPRDSQEENTNIIVYRNEVNHNSVKRMFKIFSQ